MNQDSKRTPEWVAGFVFAISIAGIMLQDPNPFDPMLLRNLRTQHTPRLLQLAQTDGVGQFAPMAMTRNMPEWRARIHLGPVQHEIQLDLMDPIESLFAIVEAMSTLPGNVGLFVVRPEGEYELISGSQPVVKSSDSLSMSEYSTEQDYSYPENKKRTRDCLEDTVGLLASVGHFEKAASVLADMNADLSRNPDFLMHQALMMAADAGICARASEEMIPVYDPIADLRRQMKQLECDEDMDSASRETLIAILSEQVDDLCTNYKLRKTF